MENKGEKCTLLASVIASLMASACCIGPIIFSILGISSLGLLTKMEPYRIVFSILALALLAMAFIYTYKKKSVKQCNENSLCGNFKYYHSGKKTLWITLVLSLGLLTFPYWSIYFV